MPYGQVTLSWARNVEADLAGYKVYYDTVPGFTNARLLQDVGLTATPLTPSVTISSFPNYGQLYFAVAAYDTNANLSTFSNVVTKGVAPFLMPLAWG